MRKNLPQDKDKMLLKSSSQWRRFRTEDSKHGSVYSRGSVCL